MPEWRYPSRVDNYKSSKIHLDHQKLNANGAPPDNHVNDFLGTVRNPMHLPLWMVGIGQSYQLFDWIDERNFYVNYDVTEKNSEGKIHNINPNEFFPDAIRGILLQSYIHGVTWMKIPHSMSDELRRRLYTRFARRYCNNRKNYNTDYIDIYATVQRITGDNANLIVGERELLMQFSCQNGRPQLFYIHD